MPRKITKSPPSDWRTSGLFSEVSIGLDDLLSPGVSNCFENSGSWLLESNFNKYGSSISYKNEEAFRDEDDYPTILHPDNNNNTFVDIKKEQTPSPPTQSHVPMFSSNEFDFYMTAPDDDDDDDVSLSDLIAFPSSDLPTPVVADVPSPNVFEDLFHLRYSTCVGASGSPEQKKVYYLSESALKAAKDFTKAGLVEENTVCDFSGFLDLDGVMDPLVSMDQSGMTSGVESEFLDTIDSNLSFPDRNYSLERVEEEQIDLMESVAFCDADLGAEEDEGVSSAANVNMSAIVSSSSSSLPSFETLNLSGMDLKILEGIVAGSGKNLGFEIGGVDMEAESDVPVEKMSKKKVRIDHQHLKDTEDESMDDDDEDDDEDEDESRRRYLERRQKNNIASRRSREIRKVKYSDMRKRADVLEVENKKLKEKIARMEKLTARMKETLLRRLRQS